MELRYVSGCTADSLTIDGVEVSELPPYAIAEVIRHLVGQCKDIAILQELLERLIESDKESVCDISHCDQCDDAIYSYTLEI